MLLRLGALARMQFAIGGNDDRLTRAHFALAFESEQIKGDRLGGNRPLRPFQGVAPAEHERTDAMYIAKRDHTKTQHQRNDRVATDTPFMHAGNRCKDIINASTWRVSRLQLMRKNIQQHFRVGSGIDVPAVLLEQLTAQNVGIDEIAVVAERNAERRVDIERLRLVGAFAACRRVTTVRDADAAAQARHAGRIEHVLGKAVALVQTQAGAVNGRDAGCVLTPMLEHGEAVIKRRANVTATNDAKNAAHEMTSEFGKLLIENAAALGHAAIETDLIADTDRQHCTRTLGEFDKLRQNAGIAPPGFARKRGQAEHQHDNDDERATTHHAKHPAEHAISTGQAGAGNKFPQHPGDDRPNKERADEHQRIREEDPPRRRVDRACQCICQLRCEQRGRNDRHRPDHQRHHLDDKAADQPDHHRSDDHEQDQPIRCRHG